MGLRSHLMTPFLGVFKRRAGYFRPDDTNTTTDTAKNALGC
jgi:hypothetical protein